MRLTSMGLKVLCLEAGGRKGQPPEETGFVPNFGRSEYPGALVGRSFGLGGSTCRWGGLLAPHSEHDRLAAGNSCDRATWDHIVATVEGYQDTVLAELGYDGEPNFFSFADQLLHRDASTLRDVGLGVISSIFLPFRKKNLARLVDNGDGRGTSKVYVRAVAKEWGLDTLGNVTNVVAVSPSGRKLRVEATKYVVASGAIECARVLLEVQRTADSIQ